MHNDLHAKERNDLSTSSNQSQLFESKRVEVVVNKKIFLIGGYYRHPNTSIQEFSTALADTLEKIKRNEHCILLGDMNIELVKYDEDIKITEYVQDIIDAGFQPYTYLPTRITATAQTIIDHVYSNFKFNIYNLYSSSIRR